MNLNSVLVTGGGSGIGAALAHELARRGCQVLISGRRLEALDAVAIKHDKISTCTGDVTCAEHREDLNIRLADLPGPRAIFHGAGYFQMGMASDLSSKDWQRSFDTNVTSRWELSRLCADLVRDGRVLFIGSDAGANPRAGAVAYSIAQSASETLRRALQSEWATQNIAITGFKPGLVDTDMVREFMAAPTDKFPSRSAYEAYVASGRITGPETIAKFAAWLLCDVPTKRFVETDWDIRDEEHHGDWCDGRLYPDAV